MFGYLKPNIDELKVREYHLYRSVYCGLCRELGKSYGIVSRLALSYDCTVVAMLSMSLKNERLCVTKRSCCFNPMKKCFYCGSGGDSIKFAAAVCVIMTYYKLCDTVRDSGIFKSLAAGAAKAVFYRGFKRASGDYPLINRAAAEMMKNQQAAEDRGADIDEAAESTAKMLSELCKMLSDDEAQKRALESFGYYVGRWIYIIDAADDFERDIKSGSFNPLNGCKDRYGEIHELMKYCNEALNLTASRLSAAYDLLELNDYKEILDNTIYSGLSKRQKQCLFDKYRHKSKKSETDYYSALTGKENDNERSL